MRAKARVSSRFLYLKTLSKPVARALLPGSAPYLFLDEMLSIDQHAKGFGRMLEKVTFVLSPQAFQASLQTSIFK